MGAKKNQKKQAALSPSTKRIFSFCALPCLLTFSAFLVLWQFVIKPGNEDKFSLVVAQLLEQQKANLAVYISETTKQVQNVIYNSELQPLLNITSLPELALSLFDKKDMFSSIEESMVSTLAHAKTANIYLPGQAKSEMEQGGDMSFFKFNMIQSIENNKAAYPEIAKSKNGEDWEIHWTIPIYAINQEFINSYYSRQNVHLEMYCNINLKMIDVSNLRYFLYFNLYLYCMYLYLYDGL